MSNQKQHQPLIVDMGRIRQALPDRAEVKLIKYQSKSPAIECFVDPSLSEEDFEMCMDWQRQIIGVENISEFYCEETGRHWFVFLKRVPFEFQNVTDDDINSFFGLRLVENGSLHDV